MKKVLVFIIMVLATVGITDYLFGRISRYYVDNYKLLGDYETIDYLIKSSTDDVVIIGSSVALNSTVSSTLEDSLGMSVWNGASNGQTLPYFETILDCLFRHHKPKVVLLGFRNDELKYQTKGSRYGILAPYYNKGFELLDSYMEEGTWVNKVMLQSNLYRYNTIWIRIILYMFIQPGEKGENGFIAKSIPPFFPVLLKKEDDPGITEKGKNEFLKIVHMCRDNGVYVIVYFPPGYEEYANHRCKAVEETKKICMENDIPVYDVFQDSLFLQHSEWFYDNKHLNRDGALIFSRQFARYLKRIMNVDGK